MKGQLLFLVWLLVTSPEARGERRAEETNNFLVPLLHRAVNPIRDVGPSDWISLRMSWLYHIPKTYFVWRSHWWWNFNMWVPWEHVSWLCVILTFKQISSKNIYLFIYERKEGRENEIFHSLVDSPNCCKSVLRQAETRSLGPLLASHRCRCHIPLLSQD